MRKIDSLGGLACLLLTLISCTVSIFTKDYYMHALFVGMALYHLDILRLLQAELVLCCDIYFYSILAFRNDS